MKYKKRSEVSGVPTHMPVPEPLAVLYGITRSGPCVTNAAAGYPTTRRRNALQRLARIAVILLLAAGISCTPVPNNGGNGQASEPSNNFDKFTLWTDSVQLRGANVYQRRVYPDLDGTEFLGLGPLGPPYMAEDFARLAALGANYVNISHTGLFTERPPYVVDTDAQQNLDELLAMIAQADMFAVISLRSGPGRGEFALFPGEDWYPSRLVNDEVWSSSAAQDAWVDMWRYVAERYRENPIVVGYDLMVEPNPADVVLGVYAPEDFYPDHAGTLLDWNQLYPRIVDGLREVDKDTPILVGAMGYSNVGWLSYLESTGDDRTIYAIHQYEPFGYTHQSPDEGLQYPGTFDADGDGAAELVNREWLEELYQGAAEFAEAHGVPVAVNEFGVHRYAPGAANYLRDQYDALEQSGMNHAIWLWGTSYPPQASVDDFDLLHGLDPANHVEVDSTLIDVLRANWEQNCIRPSGIARNKP